MPHNSQTEMIPHSKHKQYVVLILLITYLDNKARMSRWFCYQALLLIRKETLITTAFNWLSVNMSNYVKNVSEEQIIVKEWAKHNGKFTLHVLFVKLVRGFAKS